MAGWSCALVPSFCVLAYLRAYRLPPFTKLVRGAEDYYLLLTTKVPLTAHHLLPTTYYLLLTTYCFRELVRGAEAAADKLRLQERAASAAKAPRPSK